MWIQAQVFWVVMPCSVMIGYQHFRCHDEVFSGYQDEDRDGLWNVGFLTAQPSDLADSPRKLHHTQLPGKQQISFQRSLHPEDGGRMDIWNVAILPQHHMVSQPQRLQLKSSLLWKPQILQELWGHQHDLRKY